MDEFNKDELVKEYFKTNNYINFVKDYVGELKEHGLTDEEKEFMESLP